jgi:hypothetical protein
VAFNPRQGQIRRNDSSPHSKPLLEIKRSDRTPRGAPSLRRNKGRRNVKSPLAGPNLRWGPIRRNAKARLVRNKDNVRHPRARNIGRAAAAAQIAKLDKVRAALDLPRPASLADAKLEEEEVVVVVVAH